MTKILGGPLYEDQFIKEVLLLGEDEFRQLTQKRNGKQGNMKRKYRSVDDETIVEKTYLNSNDEDFPLEKQLDKWKGMDKDHVLRAF